MKLIVSIVHSDDADGLIGALQEKGYPSTKISSTGGFLREGNTTILIGTEDRNVPDVLSIIKDNSHSRTQFVTSLPLLSEPEEPYLSNPIKVQIRGAVTFVLNVEQFWRF